MFVVLAAASWLHGNPWPSCGIIPAERVEWMHRFAENIATAEQAHIPQTPGPSTQQQPRGSILAVTDSHAMLPPKQHQSHGSLTTSTGSHIGLQEQHQPAEKKATTTTHSQTDPLSKAIRRRQQLSIQAGDLTSAYAYDAIPLAVLRPVLLTRPTAEQRLLFITRSRAESLTVEVTRNAAAVNARYQGLVDTLHAGTTLPGDERAYHQYISDAKAAILLRNLTRSSPTSGGHQLLTPQPPLDQDQFSQRLGGHALPTPRSMPNHGRLDPAPQPRAVEQQRLLKSMDDLVDIDDLMQPVVLSPRESPTTVHLQKQPDAVVLSPRESPTTVHLPKQPDDAAVLASSGGVDSAVSPSSQPKSRKRARHPDSRLPPAKRVALPLPDTEREVVALSSDDGSTNDELLLSTSFEPHRPHQHSSDAETTTEPRPSPPVQRDRGKKKEARPAPVERNRRKQVRESRPEGIMYECPANAYLDEENQCPLFFDHHASTRAHCQRFHMILQPKTSPCSCAGQLADKACYHYGCAEFFAKTFTQTLDATWKPGRSTLPLRTI
jgi:hypothetical protein